MKNLRLVLTLSLVAFLATFTLAAADTYDSDAATIQKKTAATASVIVDKTTYVVPISFADGASWDNVMDHYELSDASMACLKSGHAKLSIGTDGGATWSKK
ncbi:MAG TPA: hypothetical protein VGZ93_05495 [Candidatus Methylacidiphilales bacterium]|jgi:hypothetical protein|nr:hypothetical protein [Candidatus Methylacidiphilales bacterium]